MSARCYTRFACLVLALVVQVSTCSAAGRRTLMLSAARASITEDQLHRHADLLAGDSLEGREAGSRGGQAAARYLEQQMKAAGLVPAATETSYVQPFRGTMRNLLGKIPGADPEVADEIILVGAHYDHVGYGSPQNSYGPWGYIHNGADDNASGVAALLETIEAIQTVDYAPRRTILFAFWDGEEKNLLGSRHWVETHADQLRRVRLAMNVDMVGRMVDGKLIIGGTRTGFGLRRLLSTRALPSGVAIDYTWEYKENSDHWPFYERSIPSLYVHTGTHDDYHRPTDDVERLNIAGIRQTADFLLTALVEAADAAELPTFRPAARFDTLTRKQTQEAPLPPSNQPARVGLAWRADPAEPDAVFVTRVSRGSPAEAAGLKLLDRIYEVDGLGVEGQAELLERVQEKLASDPSSLALLVERRGRLMDVEIDLREVEPSPEDPQL